MIGCALKGKPDHAWSGICEDLRNRKLTIGKRPAGYGYETLHACIGASVDVLDPLDKAGYLKLAVLLEDMPAPAVLLRSLWGGTEREIRETMDRLVDRSLASRDPDGSIRLHDFQLDFISG
jgi:hypothetical protein